MCTSAAGLQLLLAMLDALERGDWRTVLRPGGLGERGFAGPRYLVLLALTLRLVARSMQRQAQGRLDEAWSRLDEAAALLPRELRWVDSDGATRAGLPSAASRDAPVEEQLAKRVTRLVWREQFEAARLYDTFAHDRETARIVLVEAMIQYWYWVLFDHTTWFRTPPGTMVWDDGVDLDATRAVLCVRATRIRQFANPTNGRPVSQSVWRDVGGYRGLYAEALARVATMESVAPWCGCAGAEGLPVRPAREKTWQHAR